MSNQRHLPLSANINDLRTAFLKVYDAIEKASGQAGKSSVPSSGVSTSSASASSAFDSAAMAVPDLPSTYDLVQRRVIPSTEAVALTSSQCIVVADYLDVQGTLEATDSTVLVIS